MGTSDSNKTQSRFEVISCHTEKELSDGTHEILIKCKNQIISYIRFLLIKYKLQLRYQENEIFNEAYERATKVVRKGKPIPNLYGWYRITVFNIVNEHSRSENKQKKIQERISHSVMEEDSFEEDSVDFNMNADEIKRFINNEMDYRIVFLRIVDEKSWQEVCEILIQEGYYNCEVSKQFIASIRKRFSRTIKRFPSKK